MTTPAPGSDKLLYADRVLILLPRLAAAIGVDEAIMLQQIHYWLQVAGKERDGRRWIYNSHTDWTQQMPFWSKSKIGRLVTRLRALGLIHVANYNAFRYDHTFWYTVDYAAVAALVPPEGPEQPGSSVGESTPRFAETD